MRFILDRALILCCPLLKASHQIIVDVADRNPGKRPSLSCTTRLPRCRDSINCFQGVRWYVSVGWRRVRKPA
jgi:hypothetical protein